MSSSFLRSFTTLASSSLLLSLLVVPSTLTMANPSCPPVVYVGFNADPDQPSTQLPTTRGEAASQGWKPVTGGGPGPQFLRNESLPRFYLNFEGRCLAKILVDAPKPDVAPANLYETGVVGLAAEGAIIDIRSGGPPKVNGRPIPGTATEAESRGFQEGGCFGPMGGSHYSKFLGNDDDWTSLSPAIPIYDKYGSGDLKTIVAVFGNVFPSVGFDSDGVPFNGVFGCTFNFCGDANCIDQIGSAALSTVHVMFFDPANEADYAQCQQQPFGVCDGACSCCGTESDPVAQECPYPFAI